MSRPVDVLAVMDCAAETLDREADGSAGLREARAAVAELIEALSNLCSGLPHLHADLVAVLGASNAHEVMRLRTALARCRGEA